MPDFAALDLARVRTRLLTDQPFFGSLAMRLRYVADSSVGTLCTDGSEVRYNPAFMGSLGMKEQQAVVMHELSHCFMLHIFRRGGRDMRTWNQACDYAVNPLIEKAGFPLPREVKDASGKVIFSGPCIDKKYDGMSAEAIYAQLKRDEQQEQKQNAGKDAQKGSSGAEQSSDESGTEAGDETPASGSGGSGSESGQSGDEVAVVASDAGASAGSGKGRGADSGGKTGVGNGGEIPSVTGEFVDGKADAEGALPGDMNEQDWKIATEQAIGIARKAGKLPGGWIADIQAGRTPKMDAWAVIAQFIDNETQSDFRWTTPNRRLIAQGHYLPGPYKENIGEMVFAVDTSGSASSQMLTEWASNVVGLCKQFNPSKVHVVMCDTRVNGVVTYEPEQYDDITFQCKGRGGTEFQPVFDWVAEQGINPVCLIYFTDLYGPVPKEPEYPVLWAVPEYLERQRGPFGETVYVGVE